MAPGYPRIRASLHCVNAIVRFHTTLPQEQREGAVAVASAAGCRPNGGPLWRGERVEESPKGRAQDAREFAARTWMCAQRTPERVRAIGGQDARRARHRGCVSLIPFFAQAKKVTRSPAGRVEALRYQSKNQNGFPLARECLQKRELDYTRLLSRALRAIRCANVRSGILPPQSGFRRNDEHRRRRGGREQTPSPPNPPLEGEGSTRAPRNRMRVSAGA